jgi:hypothetical protein
MFSFVDEDYSTSCCKATKLPNDVAILTVWKKSQKRTLFIARFSSHVATVIDFRRKSILRSQSKQKTDSFVVQECCHCQACATSPVLWDNTGLLRSMYVCMWCPHMYVMYPQTVSPNLPCVVKPHSSLDLIWKKFLFRADMTDFL